MRENDCIITCSVCFKTAARETEITYDFEEAMRSGDFNDIWYRLDRFDICPNCRWIYVRMLETLSDQQLLQFLAHFDNARIKYNQQWQEFGRKFSAANSAA